MGLWVNINWQYNATYIQYKDCSKAHYLHDFLRQLLRRKDPSLTSTSGRRQKPANKEANGSSKKCAMMLTRPFALPICTHRNIAKIYVWACKQRKHKEEIVAAQPTQAPIPVEINRGYLEQPFYTVEWEMPVVWLFFNQKTFFTVEWIYQSCCKMVSSDLKP